MRLLAPVSGELRLSSEVSMEQQVEGIIPSLGWLRLRRHRPVARPDNLVDLVASALYHSQRPAERLVQQRLLQFIEDRKFVPVERLETAGFGIQSIE